MGLPAINVGISVSRVGSSAQTKLLKTVTADTKLYLAQYQELQDFAKFADELDKGTQEKIRRGRTIEEILKQPETSPIGPTKQMVLLRAATKNGLDSLSLSEVKEFKKIVLNSEEDPRLKRLANSLDAFCSKFLSGGNALKPEELDEFRASVTSETSSPRRADASEAPSSGDETFTVFFAL